MADQEPHPDTTRSTVAGAEPVADDPISVATREFHAASTPEGQTAAAAQLKSHLEGSGLAGDDLENAMLDHLFAADGISTEERQQAEQARVAVEPDDDSGEGDDVGEYTRWRRGIEKFLAEAGDGTSIDKDEHVPGTTSTADDRGENPPEDWSALPASYYEDWARPGVTTPPPIRPSSTAASGSGGGRPPILPRSSEPPTGGESEPASPLSPRERLLNILIKGGKVEDDADALRALHREWREGITDNGFDTDYDDEFKTVIEDLVDEAALWKVAEEIAGYEVPPIAGSIVYMKTDATLATAAEVREYRKQYKTQAELLAYLLAGGDVRTAATPMTYEEYLNSRIKTHVTRLFGGNLAARDEYYEQTVDGFRSALFKMLGALRPDAELEIPVRRAKPRVSTDEPVEADTYSLTKRSRKRSEALADRFGRAARRIGRGIVTLAGLNNPFTRTSYAGTWAELDSPRAGAPATEPLEAFPRLNRVGRRLVRGSEARAERRSKMSAAQKTQLDQLSETLNT